MKGFEEPLTPNPSPSRGEGDKKYVHDKFIRCNNHNKFIELQGSSNEI